MKYKLSCSLMVVLTNLIFIKCVAALGLGILGGNTNTNTGVRTCVINARNCGTANVCGRFGQSNLCKKFRNNCALQAANCQQSTAYTAVSARQCRNIAVGARGSCSSTGGGTYGTGGTGTGSYSYGTSVGTGLGTGNGQVGNIINQLTGGQNSNVRPVVIDLRQRRRNRRRNGRRNRKGKGKRKRNSKQLE